MSEVPQGPFVDGEFVSARVHEPRPMINPASEEAWTSMSNASTELVEASVQSASRAFERSWRGLAPGKRSRILFEIANAIRKHAARLARLESRNIGKPIADARDEIALGATVFEYYAGAIDKFCGETIPVGRGGLDFTVHEPLGVVAAITPWNFPFPIACWKVAPALAAGNCVVLKPATLSPLTALVLGQLAVEAGLPPGVLQVLPGEGGTVGAMLAHHPSIRKISFTGSTEIGRRMMAAAAVDLKRISLELGGKSPNIVFADANLERAADESPMSVFANAGQDCCARSRVFVERSVFDDFVERFVSAAEALRMGDPLDPQTQIGPLVSSAQREAVLAYVEKAQSDGRKVLKMAQALPEKGFYVSPTIVVEPAISDLCWLEEIFGPVVCIRPFDEEGEMLAEVNRTSYGLSGSVWTQDIGRAIRISRRVEAGVLSINSHSSVHVQAPFGGFKQSGIGRDLGMHALHGYTETKNIYVGETE